jgi:hypothetical protein
LGVSTGKFTPGRSGRPAITSAWSAICGTHLGLTKAVASIVRWPQAARRRISSSLTAVGTLCFSFCSPSRGPTSTMRTSVLFMPGW